MSPNLGVQVWGGGVSCCPKFWGCPAPPSSQGTPRTCGFFLGRPRPLFSDTSFSPLEARAWLDLALDSLIFCPSSSEEEWEGGREEGQSAVAPTSPHLGAGEMPPAPSRHRSMHWLQGRAPNHGTTTLQNPCPGLRQLLGSPQVFGERQLGQLVLQSHSRKEESGS